MKSQVVSNRPSSSAGQNPWRPISALQCAERPTSLPLARPRPHSYTSSPRRLLTPSKHQINTARMSARFGIRAFRAQMPARQVNTNMRFAQRRTYQSAAENPANVEGPPKSKFAQLWNSPVGPKTVHFWAPIMKVCDT